MGLPTSSHLKTGEVGLGRGTNVRGATRRLNRNVGMGAAGPWGSAGSPTIELRPGEFEYLPQRLPRMDVFSLSTQSRPRGPLRKGLSPPAGRQSPQRPLTSARLHPGWQSPGASCGAAVGLRREGGTPARRGHWTTLLGCFSPCTITAWHTGALATLSIAL